MASFMEWISRKAGLSRQEAQGGIVLLCAISLAIFVPMGISAYYRALAQTEYDRLLARVDSLNRAELAGTVQDSSRSTIQMDLGKGETEQHTTIAKPREFDPNTASPGEMQAAGIPVYLSKRIRHYVEAGGQFRKPDDVKKIYGFDAALFSKVQPWIRIKPRQESPRAPYQKVQPLDVNEADSVALEALPGIGEFTASSIIKYRNLLGGYVRLDQLYELYHQDSTRTKQFSRYLFIANGFEPQKIRINTADQVRLYHPYLSKTSSKLISAYVRQNGYLKAWEDLRTHRLVSDDELDKLRPYLSFD